jgi:hypothetical protein
MDEWPGPGLLAVYDPPRASAGLDEDPGLWEGVSAGELRERQEWMERNAGELAAQGIYVSRLSPSGAIRYFAMDEERAQTVLRQRCDEQTMLLYLGASRRVLRPHPFGSWLADGQSLHVFYGLPRNGEEAGGHVVAEREDCVIVSLAIVDWLGAQTLIGGFTPSFVTVMLEAELGARPVIDNFDNRTRPHWKTAAEVPLPRPQDL